MTTFDLSPLFRTSVGFDRLASLLNAAHRTDQGRGYPPYNSQAAGEDHYRITMAVAGFSEAELKITSEHNKLLVTGDKAEEKESDESRFLYRGIATRSFGAVLTSLNMCVSLAPVSITGCFTLNWSVRSRRR